MAFRLVWQRKAVLDGIAFGVAAVVHTKSDPIQNLMTLRFVWDIAPHETQSHQMVSRRSHTKRKAIQRRPARVCQRCLGTVGASFSELLTAVCTVSEPAPVVGALLGGLLQWSVRSFPGDNTNRCAVFDAPTVLWDDKTTHRLWQPRTVTKPTVGSVTLQSPLGDVAFPACGRLRNFQFAARFSGSYNFNRSASCGRGCRQAGEEKEHAQQ